MARLLKDDDPFFDLDKLEREGWKWHLCNTCGGIGVISVLAPDCPPGELRCVAETCPDCHDKRAYYQSPQGQRIWDPRETW
jgi:hypothetical protein